MEKVLVVVTLLALLIISLIPFVRRTETEPLSDQVRNKAQGKFIRMSHGYTHYEVDGPEDGCVVVFIHGFSVPFYMWDPTFESLARSGFRVIRYDLYGRGLSDRPRVKYNRELFLEQLLEFLDKMGIQTSVNLVGTSMGGAIATAFAASYPDRVKKVVLIDPLSKKLNIGLLSLPLLGEYVEAAFYLPSSPEKQLADFYNPDAFPDWPVRFREQMRYQGFGEALLSTARNFMSKPHYRDYQILSQYKKKVLLIWGEDDRTLGTDEAENLRAILESELYWVEKAGHIPHYERPDVVNPEIIRFLKAI